MSSSQPSTSAGASVAAESADLPVRERSGGPVAVVIPAYNEERGVGPTVEGVREALEGAGIAHEIVVVDDGSTDDTGRAAEEAGARVVRQGTNTGYGAALKAGIAATSAERVVIIDADGTYPPERVPELVERAAEADMVVGARPPDFGNVPLIRRPGKRFLTWLAAYLAGADIPDLNSGLRVLHRSVVERFFPILPDGFSFTMTVTLSMLCTGHRVAYVPVEYRPRIGESKLRAVDFMKFLILVLRTILLFNPLKVFLPVGGAIFLVGLAKFIYDLFLWNLSESAVMALLAAVILWAVGLLADMIARLQLGRAGSS